MFCVSYCCTSINNLEVNKSGFCNACLQRLNLYGRLESVCWGQTEHPLYFIWNDRKNNNLLCEAWSDFKEFIKGVGDKPEDCKLVRLNKAKPFGPDNFRWRKRFRKLNDETKKQYEIRRRKRFPEIYKSYELNKNFNITFEQYHKILEKQNFACAICKEKEKTKHHVTGEFKSLAVDHNHVTGKIRGLLCQRCNRTLGKICDDINLLDAMKDYLNAHG